MVKKKRVFYKMPNGGYVSKERVYGTRFKQDKRSGRMKGRKSVKGVGDKVGIIRVKKEFILVKKSKRRRGHNRVVRKTYREGNILGRY